MNNEDFVHVNIILQNQELLLPGEIPVFAATTNYSLDTPLIKKCDDYYLIVDSFNCSLSNIPVFIPDIQPNIPPYNNTNVDKTMYSFTMEYNGIVSDQIFVDFISQNPNKYVFPPNPAQDRTTTYYYVYTYTIMCEMFNNALNNAFINLGSKVVLPGLSTAPYFYYDNSSQKFSLVCQKIFYDLVNVVTPIKIFCNYSLFELIYSLPNTYLGDNQGNVPSSGRDFQLYVTDLGNNIISYPGVPNPAGDFIETTQNNSSIYSFFPMKSMYVATSNIPVMTSLVPRKPIEFYKNPNVVSKQQNILDIDPVIIGNLVKNRNYIQFRSVIYSPITLSSSTPLNSLNVSLYWRDRFGNSYIVYLNNNQPSNIRLLFIKRDKFMIK